MSITLSPITLNPRYSPSGAFLDGGGNAGSGITGRTALATCAQIAQPLTTSFVEVSSSMPAASNMRVEIPQTKGPTRLNVDSTVQFVRTTTLAASPGAIILQVQASVDDFATSSTVVETAADLGAEEATGGSNARSRYTTLRARGAVVPSAIPGWTEGASVTFRVRVLGGVNLTSNTLVGNLTGATIPSWSSLEVVETY